MKRFLLLSLIASLALTAKAQFIIIDTAFVAQGPGTAPAVAFYTYVVNNTGSAFTPSWKRTENTTATGWLSAICIGELCYDVSQSDGVFDNAMNDGDSNQVSIYLYPDNVNFGYNKVELTVYDAADSVNKHVVTYVEYNSWPVGAEQLSPASINVFPNPATSLLTIDHEGLQPTMWQVIGMDGRILLQYANTLTANRSVIDVNRLPAGQYILRMMLEDGKAVNQSFAKQ